ncbi:35610_t:CDS:2, partial [Gigaspora margarita]
MENVSKPFTTTDNVSIPWINFTYTGGPLKYSATACIGGKNNDMIFIFGGNPINQSLVNQFDTKKQQWINITFVGNVPSDRSYISCANFDNGLIAIFSGYGAINDLWIFNTLTLTWSLSNATNAPLRMYDYCAVALPDGNILYIGGDNSAGYMPMNKSISGPTPSARGYFSAVLTSDGRIIIFGGLNAGTVFGDLWILDITMFQWTIGKILNPIVNLTLYGHTATLVDNYMFVAFGEFNKITQNYNLSSKIFMLDVSQKDFYKWVTEFTPNTTNSSNISSDSKNTSIIIGAIIGKISMDKKSFKKKDVFGKAKKNIKVITLVISTSDEPLILRNIRYT